MILWRFGETAAGTETALDTVEPRLISEMTSITGTSMGQIFEQALQATQRKSSG